MEISNFWKFFLNSEMRAFVLGACIPLVLLLTPLVSYVNQKMKTRPNDRKEKRHVCFAHYISLLTPRCLAFSVLCV